MTLEVSLIRPKYATKEKPPIIVVRNAGIDVSVRLAMEELIQKQLEFSKTEKTWLYSVFKVLEKDVHHFI